MEHLKQKYWLILPLFASLFIYTNSLPGQFFWDDEAAILMGPEINSFYDIIAMMTFSFWNDLYNDTRQSYRKGVYRPFIRISFAIEKKLWEDNPFGYRLTNVILHSCNTGLVTVLAQTMFKSNLTALLAGLLFTSHPVNVESISYIKNRSNLIGTFFFLICLLMWIRKKYFFSNILFIISLFAKESNFLIPIIISFYILIFQTKYEWKSIFIHIFFQIMTMILFLIFSLTFLKPLHLVETYELEMIVSNVNIALRFVSTLYEYLILLFFPLNLSVDRTLPLFQSLYSLKAVTFYFCIILFIFFICKLKSYKKYLFFIGFIFINLLLVLNLIPLDSRPVAEQRLYLPGVGWAILIGGIYNELIQKIQTIKHLNYYLKQVITYTFHFTFLFIICFYSFSVINRNSLFKDVLLLWQDAERKNPEIARIHYNSGIIYFNRQEYNNAIKSFNKCLKLNAKYPYLNMQLGKIYEIKGNFESAINKYKREIELYKFNIRAEYMLAELYKKINNYNEAYRHFYNIIQKKSDHRDAYFQLGYIKYLNREYDLALQFYKKTLEIDPNYYESFNDIGLIYFNQKKFIYALDYFNKALKINPYYYTGYYNAAYTYQILNHHDKAIEYYKKTIDFNYQYYAAYNNMAYIYSIHGQYKKAIEIYKKVILLKPDYIDAYIGITDAYYAIKDYSNAMKICKKIIKIDNDNKYAHNKIKILDSLK